MNNQIIAKAKKISDLNYIFCDYYDTIIHRKVHPLQTFRIWAKIISRELGLDISINELAKYRKTSMSYLRKKTGLYEAEIAYETVIREVYQRLCNEKIVDSKVTFETFLSYAAEADFQTESSVQYVNKKTVQTLEYFKAQGYKIFCVSDFHCNQALMTRLIKFHGLDYLYDKIYISCSENACKENKGSIYKSILEKEHISKNEVLMIGDNLKSDVTNAFLHGIEGFYLKHQKQKLQQKYQMFDTDKKDYRKQIKHFEKELKSKEYPYAEYLIIFHVFIERLYAKARKEGIKNLFFLAREGQFLKRLFDTYQKDLGGRYGEPIKSHYLKISRQAAMQISFKPLEEEDFYILKTRYFDSLSLGQFLNTFLFKEDIILKIANNIAENPDTLIEDFFESELYQKLINDALFQKLYEENRVTQKKYFNAYLKSFNVNLATEGMHLVDVGWRGSMQDRIYAYFEGEYNVEGYYLGIEDVYDVKQDLKRHGLIFTVYPFSQNGDLIMKANKQLFEQFLSASHGSTLGYDSSESFTIEYHKKEELEMYTKYIGPIQEYMYSNYSKLLSIVKTLTYDNEITSDYLLDLKIRSDLMASRKKISFVDELEKNFFNNLGNNKVGVTYGFGDVPMSLYGFIKRLILYPEQMFRYLVKIKPFMYRKKLFFLTWPINFFKPYLKYHLRFKKKIFKRGL